MHSPNDCSLCIVWGMSSFIFLCSLRLTQHISCRAASFARTIKIRRQHNSNASSPSAAWPSTSSTTTLTNATTPKRTSTASATSTGSPAAATTSSSATTGPTAGTGSTATGIPASSSTTTASCATPPAGRGGAAAARAAPAGTASKRRGASWTRHNTAARGSGDVTRRMRSMRSRYDGCRTHA